MRCHIVYDANMRQRIKDSQWSQSADLMRSGGAGIATLLGNAARAERVCAERVWRMLTYV